MVIVDLEGQKCCGDRNPSSELGMHLLVYRTRPDIHAVVHAAPGHSDRLCGGGDVAGRAAGLGDRDLSRRGATREVRHARNAGAVRGVAAIRSRLRRHLDGEPRCSHLWPRPAQRLYEDGNGLEHFARIALVTHQLGRQQLLTKEEVDKLLECREKYEGVTSVAKMLPRLSMTRGQLVLTRCPRGTSHPHDGRELSFVSQNILIMAVEDVSPLA